MLKWLLCSLWIVTNCNCLDAYELAIATMFKNEAPYLKEWIEYHRMVGVEHFWLYNDASDDDWKDVLQPYITEGLVEVIDWPSKCLKNFISFQCMAAKDALTKSKGITKWLAIIDIDEFLLPAEESTVTECLAKHFNDTSAVYVNWHHFGTGGIYLREGESVLFKLTSCGTRLFSRNGTGKSIVRPEYVIPSDIWNIHHFVLTPLGIYYDGDALPMNRTGIDLKTEGKPHNQFIRLNHYMMRDEHFFHTTRLPRSIELGIEEWLVWEHYFDLNREKDYKIVDFILERHPDMYNKYWKDHVFN